MPQPRRAAMSNGDFRWVFSRNIARCAVSRLKQAWTSYVLGNTSVLTNTQTNTQAKWNNVALSRQPKKTTEDAADALT